MLLIDKDLDSFKANETITEFSSFSDISINLYVKEKSDSEVSKHFKNTVEYQDLKQFECGIPEVHSSPPHNFPHNDQHKEVHLSEVANKSLVPVSISELEDPKVKMHSLHHFQVYKETISKTPCRRVFDASFRTKGDISLKDCRTKGPFLTPSILKVQLCMR